MQINDAEIPPVSCQNDKDAVEMTLETAGRKRD